ncbi:MAG: hypothetical protein RIA63_13005 [Cyclobacteriaceae bacterium]
MKMQFHNVLKIGVFIYTLFLASGIYFSVKNAAQADLPSIEIVQLIADTDSEDASSSTKKSFNSRPVIEDDDDSAKDLFAEMKFKKELFVTNYTFHAITYSSFELAATTPPPKV